MFLSADIKSLFGGAKINLDGCGDSTPRYAIYQLQDDSLEYHKIGTWNHDNDGQVQGGRLKLSNELRMEKLRSGKNYGTKCLPTCKGFDKPVLLQRVM